GHHELAGGERSEDDGGIRPTRCSGHVRNLPWRAQSVVDPRPRRAGQRASASSIAATITGSSGATVGAKRRATVPSLAMKDFSKVPKVAGCSVGLTTWL